MPQARELGYAVDERQRLIGRLAEWMRTGALKYREDILDGIDKASDAITGLYRGDNLGKRLIRLRA